MPNIPRRNGYMPGYVKPKTWHTFKPNTTIYTPAWKLDTKDPFHYSNQSNPTFQQALENLINDTVETVAPLTQPHVLDAVPNPSSYNGTGPYELEFSLTPDEAAQLYVQDAHIVELIYDILIEGINPYSAEAQFPLGTEGTLKTFETFIMEGPAMEYHGAVWMIGEGKPVPAGTPGAYLWNPLIYGNPANLPDSGIPPQFLNVKPKKKKKKKGPTWLFGSGF